MIEQSESGLGPSAYNALLQAINGDKFQLVAHQWDLDFAAAADGAGTGVLFDAALYDGKPYRINGPLLEVFESSSWSAVDGFSAVSSHVDTINSSLTVDGSDLLVFMASGSAGAATVYQNNYDGSSWSGWSQLESTTFEILHLAGTRDGRCHMVVDSGNDLYELICIDDGSLARQDLFWPFPIESFAASATAGTTDVVVITSMTPGVVQTRVVNVSLVRSIIPAGGLLAFTYKNGTYSDHIEVDGLDEWQPWRFRRNVTVSRIDSLLYAICYSSDGTKTNQIRGHRLYTSKDGINWSRGEFLVFPAATTGGLKLLRDDVDRAYGIQAVKTFLAPSTLMVGLSSTSMQLDLTDKVDQIQLSFSDMAQLVAELNDQNYVISQDTILNGEHTVALTWREGFYPSTIQTAIMEIDTYERLRGVSPDGYSHSLRITARDRLMWMSDKTQSEQFLYRDPILVAGDNYEDNTQSGYGGMAHTATWEGSWRTTGNELILWSNNEEGQAASTHKIDAWNFDTHISFNLSQVANDEFAGLHFRSTDHRNQWRAYFDQPTDKIRVVHRVDDADTLIATSASTLGWAASPTTIRHLRVRGYYGRVYVYISTDGISWGSPHLTVTFPGQAALPDTEIGSFPTYRQQSGYVGPIGRGYNPNEEWDFDFDFSYTIDWQWEFYYNYIYVNDVNPSGPGMEMVTRAVGIIDYGTYSDESYANSIPIRTKKVDGGNTIWEVIPGLSFGIGSPTYGTGRVSLIQDPSIPSKYYYWVRNAGLWECAHVWSDYAEFVQVADAMDMYGIATTTLNGLGGRGDQLVMDKAAPGWMAFVLSVWFFYSLDYGRTWAHVRIANLHSSYSYANMLNDLSPLHTIESTIDVNKNNTGESMSMWCLIKGDSHDSPSYSMRLYKSVNWGVSWTVVSATGLPDDNYHNIHKIHIPYRREDGSFNLPDEHEVIYVMLEIINTHSHTGMTYKSVDGGSTFVLVHEAPDANGFLTSEYLATSNYDGRYGWAYTHHRDTGKPVFAPLDDQKLFFTQDGFATRQEVMLPPNLDYPSEHYVRSLPILSPYYVGVLALPVSRYAALGAQNEYNEWYRRTSHIWYTKDYGVHWADIRGNLRTLFKSYPDGSDYGDMWASPGYLYLSHHPAVPPVEWDWEYTVDFTEKAGLWVASTLIDGCTPQRDSVNGYQACETDWGGYEMLLTLATPGGYDPELTLTEVRVTWEHDNAVDPMVQHDYGNIYVNGGDEGIPFSRLIPDNPGVEKETVFTPASGTYTGVFSVTAHIFNRNYSPGRIKRITVRGLGENPYEWEYTVDFTQEAGLWVEDETFGNTHPGRENGVGWHSGSYTTEISVTNGLRLMLDTPGGFDPDLTITEMSVVWEVTSPTSDFSEASDDGGIGILYFLGDGDSPNFKFLAPLGEQPYTLGTRTDTFTHPGYTGVFSVWWEGFLISSAPTYVIKSITVRGLGENPYVPQEWEYTVDFTEGAGAWVAEEYNGCTTTRTSEGWQPCGGQDAVFISLDVPGGYDPELVITKVSVKLQPIATGLENTALHVVPESVGESGFTIQHDGTDNVIDFEYEGPWTGFNGYSLYGFGVKILSASIFGPAGETSPW